MLVNVLAGVSWVRSLWRNISKVIICSRLQRIVVCLAVHAGAPTAVFLLQDGKEDSDPLSPEKLLLDVLPGSGSHVRIYTPLGAGANPDSLASPKEALDGHMMRDAQRAKIASAEEQEEAPAAGTQG